MKVKHVVTEAQSKRIGIKAGQVIYCIMKGDHDLPPSLKGKRIARDYYIGGGEYGRGRRMGGTLALDE